MHHTEVHRPTRPAAVRCRRGEEFSPLAELDRAFLALAAGGRVSLPGEVVLGEEGVGGVLAVDQVRAALAHPAAAPQVRAGVWREVVVRAQTRGEPWVTVAAGLAVPLLRRVLSRVPCGGAVERGEVEQEALAAFLAALRAADPQDGELVRGLVAAADRAVHRHVYAVCRDARATARRGFPGGREEQVPAPQETGCFGDEYQALLAAVRAGVITCREAQVIARTRLGGESMTALAFERRMSRRHFYRHRADAEQRLAAFLTGVTRQAPA